MGVEPQKTNDAAQYCHRLQKHIVIAHRERQQADHADTQEGCSCRQTIQTVRKIYRIRDTQKREDCQRIGNIVRNRIKAVKRDISDADSAVEHNHTYCKQLTEKLDPEVERNSVVPHTKEQNKSDAVEQGIHFPRRIHPQQDGYHRSYHHRQSTNPRHRRNMHLARIGHIHEREPIGIAHQRRDQHHCDEHCDNERKKGQHG